MRYWFRRRASDGRWWSVYVAADDEYDFAGMGAWTVFAERRIYLLAGLASQYPRMLAHEWQHVENYAHGVDDTGSAHHAAIDAGAALAARVPRIPPPDVLQCSCAHTVRHR